jgi:hypothetical protein
MALRKKLPIRDTQNMKSNFALSFTFAATGKTYVVLVLVAEALVRVEDRDGNAHAALVAVPECLDAPHATEPAQVAVERLLAQAHPQVAHVAMVLPESRLAVGAKVPA